MPFTNRQYGPNDLSFQLGEAYDRTTVVSDLDQGYYTWHPDGSTLTVQLSYDVIDRMNVDVMRGFGAVRRRGTEVGGILLGRIDVDGELVTITIDDYQPVECHYAHGPSYILSGDDLQDFRKALAESDPSTNKPAYTVGFYRGHTRDDFALDESDVRFFREYFPDPLHVVLLIKPFASRAPIAGFFVQENGVLKADQSPLEFPFRRRDLGGGAAQPQRGANGGATATGSKPASDANGPSPVVLPAPAAQPSVKYPPITPAPFEERPMFAQYSDTSSAWRARLGWFAMSVMLVVFGIVLGMQYSGNGGNPITVSSAPDPYALSLSVSRVDDNLLVKWDPQSPAVKTSWRGVLTIVEGSDSKNVQIDPMKLQFGSVLYRHVAPEVEFRLEVFLKEHRTVAESVTWHMPSGEAVLTNPQPQQAQ